MFEGLTKSKFYTKCKSSLRMTKTRLDTLKKKKSAVAKFLKNDVADLLRSGLDDNAYNRAEGIMVEQNVIACYNFIDEFCGCISNNLSVMNKQRECPEECKAAVQSLIYAAARFSEFPELRELRSLFTERYGSYLEPCINKEFVELLKPKACTKEMKLQLMHDIANEFSIDWSSKALEQKLFKPPQPQHDQSEHQTLNKIDEHGSNWKNTRGDMVQKRDNNDDIVSRRSGLEPGNKFGDVKEDTTQKGNVRQPASHRRKNSFEGQKMQSSREDEALPSSRGNGADRDSVQATSSSMGSGSDDVMDNKKPFYYRFIAPPYIKSKVEKEEPKMEDPANRNAESDLVSEAKPKPRSVRRKPQMVEHQDVGNAERLQKSPSSLENAGSVVGSSLKPPPGRGKPCNERSGSGVNITALEKFEAKWGSRMSEEEEDDDSEEEEKMMDELLMHYSKKESPYKLKEMEHHPHLKPASSDDVGRRRNAKSGVQPPVTESDKASKGHARSASEEPGRLSGGFVHPNLPDYDELAARVAALRGK